MTQYKSREISTALKLLKKKDTFCVLGITNEDLYPDENDNFVFGEANMEDACGVFSFRRFQADFPGNDFKDQNMIESACYIMAHEITHMFGLRHCIYYECLMNGTMSARESHQKLNNTLCPACLKKLKINLKFDTRTWFQNMYQVSKQLEFSKEASVYDKILKFLDTCPNNV